MTRRLALWLALRTIEVVAILVPAAARSDWKREWHGELRYRSAQLQRRRKWRLEGEHGSPGQGARRVP